MCLHGCSPLQQAIRVHGLGRLKDAAAIAGVYAATPGAFFAMDYGLHAVEYGRVPVPPRSVVVRRQAEPPGETFERRPSR